MAELQVADRLALQAADIPEVGRELGFDSGTRGMAL